MAAKIIIPVVIPKFILSKVALFPIFILYLILKNWKRNVFFGTFSPDSCDYADFGHLLANAVEQKDVDLGIAVCGSGISMTLNKHQYMLS
jgi:ribose 5-phosphate isomerase RpiB